MDTGLTNKNVVVTGASGGIGGSIARLFAAESANVAVHFNSGQNRAEELAKSIEGKTVNVQADLTDENSVINLFAQVEKQLGASHVLIANAGFWPNEDTKLCDMSLARWNKTITINLTSVFLCTREFLKRCREHSIEDPAIVMIGSTAGHFGEAHHGDYASAKSGLMGGLLQTLKNEIPTFASKGRVNVVSPGWTMTPMARDFASDQQAMDRALQTIAMKKFASPEDIAKAALFFASNVMSGHVTGQNLFVAGGMEGRVLYP